MAKTPATLSLDLDNQWSYMKSGAIPGWEEFPSYFDLAVPRMLDCLARHGATITVFVVGQDAALEKNAAALRSIARAGHEIANHSFHHEPWLNLRPAGEIGEELRRAHEAIAAATGQSPVGFRSPAFSLSTPVLNAIKELGYTYDASTFPTFIGPLARMAYFLTSGFSREQRQQRARLFGSVADGLRPLKPYRWTLPAADLIELPVTTFPLVRLPFHLSYISFLAAASRRLALAYFRSAILACRVGGVRPSLLLHPLDFLGREDVPCLKTFPGMQLDAKAKLALVDEAVGAYCDMFNVQTLHDFCRDARQGEEMPVLTPRFSADPKMTAWGALAEELE